jgi:hypothetical protein
MMLRLLGIWMAGLVLAARAVAQEPPLPVPAPPVTFPAQPTVEEKQTEIQAVALPEVDPPIPVNPPRDKALPAPPTITPPATTPPAEAATDPAAVAAAKEKELGEKLGTIGKAIEGLASNLTITTGDSNIKVLFGGSIVGDFMFNTARPVAPGTPFFLTPRPIAGFNQQTFDANARQSVLFAYVKGPDVCGFEAGGVVAVCFYDGSIIQDIYGVLPLQAYAQLKNDDWRFAAGLQFDIFNPLNPTVLPFSYLGGSGNAGAGFPAQARAERYIHLDNETQITVTAGLSNPVSTTVNNNLVISEDNGWPNVEGRVALGLGCLSGEGPLAHRPFELGLSGVIGQLRTTNPFQNQVIAGIWGLGSDCRWAANDHWGVQGEVFVGQTLGAYTAGILQNVNAATFAGVHTAGGWAEVYYYICPETLHTHFGYGIDDPLDSDLAPGQPVRNETYFANLIWDPSKYFRWGFEVTYRKTAYTVFNNNDGVGIETQVQFRF